MCTYQQNIQIESLDIRVRKIKRKSNSVKNLAYLLKSSLSLSLLHWSAFFSVQCQLFTFVASGRSSTIQRGSPSPHLAIFPPSQNAACSRLARGPCGKRLHFEGRAVERTRTRTSWTSFTRIAFDLLRRRRLLWKFRELEVRNTAI